MKSKDLFKNKQTKTTPHLDSKELKAADVD